MKKQKETLQYLLKGKNEFAQQQLDDFFIGIPDNPNLSWYPSCGTDYHDITELSPEKVSLDGLSEFPHLFLHTDCLDALSGKEEGDLLDKYDEGTTVLNSSVELIINPEAGINFKISSEFTWFYNDDCVAPVIRLLNVTRTTPDGFCSIANVISFVWENNNFLDEFILKFNIRISHLVKVREGLAEGGVRISITYALSMLSVLGTKYLVFGDLGWCDPVTKIECIEQERMIFKKHHLKPLGYDLHKICEVGLWSGFPTGFYKIEYLNKVIRDGYFLKHLGLLGRVCR